MTTSCSQEVVWTRDGDQHVGSLGSHEARLTPWFGPLGDAVTIRIDGKDRGQCGGGETKNLLPRAKERAEEYLRKAHAKISVGDIVTWRDGGPDSNAIGICNCEVLELGTVPGEEGTFAKLRVNITGHPDGDATALTHIDNIYKE